MKTPLLVSESGILFPGERGGKHFRGRDLGVFIPIFFLLRDSLHFHLFPLLKSSFRAKVQSFGEEYLTVISQTC